MRFTFLLGTLRDVAPGTELWVEPLPYFHKIYQTIIQKRGVWGAAWAGSRCSQETGGLHAVTPEPPMSPLSCHWQMGAVPYSTSHRNFHFLPIILKLIFGSEQTSRGVKALDKKSVSP